mmetsp:Transcript_54412/g.116907  ORF Transcript_54412/g.116907 Transcript_54412/m.116907 type:complete len:211 (+) Transcript_54412:1905-2537(+)
MCEGVSSRRTEQSSGETLLIGPGNNSSNFAEHHAVIQTVTQKGLRGTTGKLSQSLLCGFIHELFLNSCGLLLSKCIVIGLEIDELTIQLAQCLLNPIQSHVRLIGQEVIQSVPRDAVARRGSNTFRKEPDNTIHFVQTLDVSAVRAGKGGVVHVLNLHVAMVPQLVEKVSRRLHWQNQGAMPHRLRPKHPHGGSLATTNYGRQHEKARPP